MKDGVLLCLTARLCLRALQICGVSQHLTRKRPQHLKEPSPHFFACFAVLYRMNCHSKQQILNESCTIFKKKDLYSLGRNKQFFYTLHLVL